MGRFGRPARHMLEEIDVGDARLPQHERAQRRTRPVDELRLVMRPFEYGCTASFEMRVSVGDMMTSVSTSARPVSTVFGGSAAAPIADRTSESTTTIRTNDVHITSRNGAMESTVSAASVSSGSVACA